MSLNLRHIAEHIYAPKAKLALAGLTPIKKDKFTTNTYGRGEEELKSVLEK